MKTIITFLIGFVIGFVLVYMNYELNYFFDSPEYQFVIVDDSVMVSDYNRQVGTIVLEGELKTLINKDNE